MPRPLPFSLGLLALGVVVLWPSTALTQVEITLPDDSYSEDKNAPSELNGSEYQLGLEVDAACGQTDRNSPCQACVAAGVPIVKSPRCVRGCVDIPKGKEVVSVQVMARDGWNDWKPCGAENSPGPCGIGWCEWMGNEWYEDKSRFCVRFKNWSHDRHRSVLVNVRFDDPAAATKFLCGGDSQANAVALGSESVSVTSAVGTGTRCKVDAWFKLSLPGGAFSLGMSGVTETHPKGLSVQLYCPGIKEIRCTAIHGQRCDLSQTLAGPAACVIRVQPQTASDFQLDVRVPR